jgi:hypothetical protein
MFKAEIKPWFFCLDFEKGLSRFLFSGCILLRMAQPETNTG